MYIPFFVSLFLIAFFFLWFVLFSFDFFFCHEMNMDMNFLSERKIFGKSYRTLTSELTLVPFIIRVILRVRQCICSVYVRGAVLSSGPVRHMWQQDRIRLLFLLHHLLQWTAADLAVHTPDATHRANGSDSTPRRQLIREKKTCQY